MSSDSILAKMQAKRRNSNRIIWILTAVTFVVIVIIGGVYIASRKGTATRGVLDRTTNVVRGSPEQRGIRKWLKENLDSGEWEEVKWEPTENNPAYLTPQREAKVRRELEIRQQEFQAIERGEKKFDRESELEREKLMDELGAFDRGGKADKRTRLKFRTQGPFGGKILLEWVFYTRDGEVVQHYAAP